MCFLDNVTSFSKNMSILIYKNNVTYFILKSNCKQWNHVVIFMLQMCDIVFEKKLFMLKKMDTSYWFIKKCSHAL